MKSIGLDLGSRTCGVSISDALGMIARTYDTIRFEDDDYETALKSVVDICKKENVTNVVLGNPKHMNGDEGIRSQISYDFKKRLEENGLTVTLIDERLTTVVAERSMLACDFSRKKRKQKKDEVAAVTILQDYLDSKGGFSF